MTEVINYVPDEREFSVVTLENGLKCCFIRDASLVDFNFSFALHSDITELPPELIGLDGAAFCAVWRGSERYPGLTNFKEFAELNGTTFEHRTTCGRQELLATIPEHALNEYLDRIADMVTNPEITKESMEFTAQRHCSHFYAFLNDDWLRSNAIIEDLILPQDTRKLQMYKRKDLVPRVRNFISRNYCPSKMMLVLSGNMSLENMRQLVLENFDWIPRKSDVVPQVYPRLRFCPSDESKITLARGYTRFDTNMLAVDFRLPQGMSSSSSMFIAYLLATSKVGSLQHKLRSEGLIEELHARLSTRAEDSLYISILQTTEGSRNSVKILSLLMGYIELIKQMQVTEELFREAHQFHVCIQRKDEQLVFLDRVTCDMHLGVTNAEELRFAEIPYKFDPAEIKLCAESLIPKNCIAAALSNQYKEAPLKDGTDYYLQYFTDEVTIEPCSDGLVLYNPDPLLAGCEVPLVEDIDLHTITPNVFLRSIAGESYSTVKIGVKSPEFSKYSLPAQRIYAEMISYKLSLVTSSIFETKVEVDDDTLSVSIKCPPKSVCQMMSLVCGYLSKPIEDEYLGKLLELKQEKECLVDEWLSGDTELAYLPDFEEIQKSGFDIEVQKQQLEAINQLDDLPRTIKGEVVLLFSGNAHPVIAHRAARATDVLNSTIREETCDTLPTTRDTKQAMTREYFKQSSICKLFNAGPFSHSGWVLLTLIRRVIIELFSDAILVGSRTSSTFSAETIFSRGNMWLSLKLSGDATGQELERKLDRCIFEDLPQLLRHIHADFVEAFRDIVWEDLITAQRDVDKEASRLWSIVKQHPQDHLYCKEIRKALLDISAASIKKVYTLYLSRERCYGTRTFIWKPREIQETLAGLEVAALGVYRPRLLSAEPPPPKRLKTAEFDRDLLDMIMRTNDIMDMLGLNDDGEE